MLIDRDWQGTGQEQHELICGEFASRYFIDPKECYGSKQASHEYEKIKFNRYIQRHWN